MKFHEEIPIEWVAQFIDAHLIGEKNGKVQGMNEIHKVKSGDLSFVDNEKYYKQSLQSAATFIIIDQEIPAVPGKTLLVCSDPFSAFVKLAKYFKPFEPANQMVSISAQIGENTVIQPGVFIGNHVKIGKNCLIHPNVSIYDHSEIGDHVIIHSGTVIGSDAFYFKSRKERGLKYDKFFSSGRVLIADFVEIGAGCTIDKGVSGDTIIGAGTKLDNQVHIGHGVVIGKNCLLAAQVGVAGKTILEDDVILWGQAGINKNLRIGKGAVVYAQSGVGSNIEPGKVHFGTPSEDARTKMRELNWIKRIPEMWERLKS